MAEEAVDEEDSDADEVEEEDGSDVNERIESSTFGDRRNALPE